LLGTAYLQSVGPEDSGPKHESFFSLCHLRHSLLISLLLLDKHLKTELKSTWGTVPPPKMSRHVWTEVLVRFPCLPVRQVRMDGERLVIEGFHEDPSWFKPVLTIV
jgi:hypothetical protein